MIEEKCNSDIEILDMENISYVRGNSELTRMSQDKQTPEWTQIVGSKLSLN